MDIDAAGAVEWRTQIVKAEALSKADHYEILGVESSVTPDELKRAYRVACLKWHPDRSDGSRDGQYRSGVMFKLVQEAYGVVNDPAAKALYDAERAIGRNGHLYEDDEEHLYSSYSYARGWGYPFDTTGATTGADVDASTSGFEELFEEDYFSDVQDDDLLPHSGQKRAQHIPVDDHIVAV